MHGALYTGKNRKTMPRDLDKDPDSQLALAGVFLEYPVRSVEVSGVKLI